MHADVWFRYESTCNGTLTVSNDNASFDTDLVVYRGACGNLVQLACNGDDDDCGGFTSRVQLAVTAETSYLIRIGGWEAGERGTGTLLIECDGAP